MIQGVLVLTCIVAGVAFLPRIVWRWPLGTVLGAIFVTSLLDCLQLGENGVALGANLYIGDAAVAILLFAGLLLLTSFRMTVPHDAIPCLLLLALGVLDFCRGVSTYGLRSAGNNARDLVFFTVPAAVFMLLAPLFRFGEDRLAYWLAAAGSIFGTVAILRWAGALPMELLNGELEEGRVVYRALFSWDAHIVGLGFIATLYLLTSTRRSIWIQATSVFLGVETVMLQHRSVWVATATGSLWFFIRTVRTSASYWFNLAIVSLAAVILVIVIRPDFAADVRALIVDNVEETQTRDSTWAWRVEGYKEATDRQFNYNSADMLFGPPSGWSVNTTGGYASMHIHSRYVGTLANYGVIGFVALLFWFGVLAKRIFWPIRVFNGNRGLCASERVAFLQALFLSTILYLVPYPGGILHGTVLGLMWITARGQDVLIPLRPRILYRGLLEREGELNAPEG